jgi:sensor domain CHASE-containing protein
MDMANGDQPLTETSLDLIMVIDANGAEQYINPAAITRAEFRVGEPPEKPSLTLLLISSGGAAAHTFYVEGERALVLRKELRRRAGFSEAPAASLVPPAPLPLPPRRFPSTEK